MKSAEIAERAARKFRENRQRKHNVNGYIPPHDSGFWSDALVAEFTLRAIEESQVQQDPRPWTPRVEEIRKEMMARFSDKLSMEEIAEFAYSIGGDDTRELREARARISELEQQLREIKEGK